MKFTIIAVGFSQRIKNDNTLHGFSQIQIDIQTIVFHYPNKITINLLLMLCKHKI